MYEVLYTIPVLDQVADVPVTLVHTRGRGTPPVLTAPLTVTAGLAPFYDVTVAANAAAALNDDDATVPSALPRFAMAAANSAQALFYPPTPIGQLPAGTTWITAAGIPGDGLTVTGTAISNPFSDTTAGNYFLFSLSAPLSLAAVQNGLVLSMYPPVPVGGRQSLGTILAGPYDPPSPLYPPNPIGTAPAPVFAAGGAGGPLFPPNPVGQTPSLSVAPFVQLTFSNLQCRSQVEFPPQPVGDFSSVNGVSGATVQLSQATLTSALATANATGCGFTLANMSLSGVGWTASSASTNALDGAGVAFPPGPVGN